MPSPKLWQPAAYALFVLTASTTAWPTAPAPDREPARQPQQQEKILQIKVGKHELHDVLVQSAKFLGRNYLMDRSGVCNTTNTVEIQKSMDLDADEAEAVVSQIAFSAGYVIMPVAPKQGLYEVVALRGPRAEEIYMNALEMTPEQVVAKRHVKVVVTTNVECKHIDANVAARQLRPFFSTATHRISFGTTGQPNFLIIQGFANQVATAIKLLQRTDQPTSAKDPNQVPMQTQLDQLRERVQKLEALVPKSQDKK